MKKTITITFNPRKIVISAAIVANVALVAGLGYTVLENKADRCTVLSKAWRLGYIDSALGQDPNDERKGDLESRKTAIITGDYDSYFKAYPKHVSRNLSMILGHDEFKEQVNC